MALTASPIGILAGSGSLPVDGAAALTARGGSVYVVRVEPSADAALRAYPHTNVNWAQLGRAIAAFKAAGVKDVVMLGATGRPSFRNARPDWGFIRALPSVLKLLNAGGDDAVLRGLIGLFERNGLRIASVADVAPELLVDDATLTKQTPSAVDDADIARGFALVRALGKYDIGQGVVIESGRIAAIEAAEGTDRMLMRLAACRSADAPLSRSGVLVKRPKPGQDLRVDLPTIGASTLRNAGAAGLAGVAVMAGQVIAAERDEMITEADSAGLFIAGKADVVGDIQTPTSFVDQNGLQSLSKAKLSSSEHRNLMTAVGALDVLSKDGNATLVIVGRRVLSIGINERAEAVIRRSALVRRKKARAGLAAIDARLELTTDTVREVDAARLAGVLLVATQPASRLPPIAPALALADEIGLFVATTHTGA